MRRSTTIARDDSRADHAIADSFELTVRAAAAALVLAVGSCLTLRRIAI